jgi:hypothetical protein
MKAIHHSEFARTDLSLATSKWTTRAASALHGLKVRLASLARLNHRTPSFREQHLLDRDLGAEIRRASW